ncbi:MAG: hypothetical protein AAFO74_03815 [Pseudomonadota bacterium]
MWQMLRSISDTLGVGFLIMQLIKLIGMVFALVGPLKFISSLFEGIFPVIASFFKVNFGWTINGLDVMAIAIAMSGTLIVWSSVARHEAMHTRYIFRFFMIPYAFLVILVAIVVQVTTPIVEINHFNSQCKGAVEDVSFYGSDCQEMSRQLAFWDETFGDAPIDPPIVTEPDLALPETSEMPDPVINEDEDFTGISFFLAMMYLILVLPIISLFVFFFKRLSVNKLLKRVAIAGGSAGGLALASAAYASVFSG